uniref:Uncharacterized protein n=1 Tax=Anguilla anguilla TaxID=7936 RepID=A0A0E9VP24_ANGAN
MIVFASMDLFNC